MGRRDGGPVEFAISNSGPVSFATQTFASSSCFVPPLPLADHDRSLRSSGAAEPPQEENRQPADSGRGGGRPMLLGRLRGGVPQVPVQETADSAEEWTRFDAARRAREVFLAQQAGRNSRDSESVP